MIYGIHLPDDVLEKFITKTTERIFAGEKLTRRASRERYTRP